MVSGRLFIDKNNNRVYDSGEKGIDNATIQFLKSKTKTGDGGRFIFRNLPPGTGEVRYQMYKSEPVFLEKEPTSLINIYIPVPSP